MKEFLQKKKRLKEVYKFRSKPELVKNEEFIIKSNTNKLKEKEVKELTKKDKEIIVPTKEEKEIKELTKEVKEPSKEVKDNCYWAQSQFIYIVH